MPNYTAITITTVFVVITDNSGRSGNECGVPGDTGLVSAIATGRLRLRGMISCLKRIRYRDPELSIASESCLDRVAKLCVETHESLLYFC